MGEAVAGVGRGPPVALAHGFVGDARSTWGSQIDALADEFAVVAWDAPGVGRSPDPPEGFGMDDYADCFAALLRALRIEQAHLVGLSFCGALVLATFHRHRDLASSLALVSGYAGWRGSLGAEGAEQRLARSLQASGLPPEEFAAAMVPSMFSPSAGGELVAAFVDSVRAFRPGGFRAMAGASFDDQSHVLPEVDVPTLLLYADHDVRAPVVVGEAIHAEVRGSELVVLRGPGHVSPVEAPDDVTRELRRFLRSVEKPDERPSSFSALGTFSYARNSAESRGRRQMSSPDLASCHPAGASVASWQAGATRHRASMYIKVRLRRPRTAGSRPTPQSLWTCARLWYPRQLRLGQVHRRPPAAPALWPTLRSWSRTPAADGIARA